MGRILALDFGTKRIGIAISDESKKIAFAQDYIPADQKQRLLGFTAEKDIEKILLGLPRNLKGEETEAAEAVREFGAWLQKETNLPIEYIDERYSTKELIKQGASREEIDSLVAQKMLARYLNAQNNSS